jgi:GAF domain-containing protein
MIYQNLPDILSLAQVSKLLNIHKNTLRRWELQGILPSVRFGKRKDRYYKKNDVLRIFNSGRSKIIDPVPKITQEIDMLSKLFKLQSNLSKLLTFNTVINTITHDSAQIVDAQSTALFLFLPDKQRLKRVNSHNPERNLIEGQLLIPLSVFLPLTHSFNKKTILYYNNQNEIIKYFPHLEPRLKETNIESLVTLPLIVDNLCVGILEWYFDRPQRFSKTDLVFFLKIAKICNTALQKATLFTQEKNAHIQAKKHQDLFDNIYHFSSKLHVTDSLSQTHQTIVEELKKLLEIEYASLIIRENDGYKRIYSSSDILYNIAPRPNGITAKAFSEKQPFVTSVQLSQEQVKKMGVRSIISVPLWSGNTPLGLLSGLSKKETQFLANDIKVLNMFSVIASLKLAKI